MHRSILALALPAIVTNITTPILGLLDVGIMGHISGAVYIAAIAVGSTMFNMLYWLFGFLRMGTSGMTAQCYGANDEKESALILYRALLIALVVGLMIVLFRSPICEVALRFLDTDVSTSYPARTYFLLASLGAPAVLATYAMTGWLLGMQNSKAGMWISLVINTTNIVISVILVFVFNLDVEGVAMGTATAQWIGAVVSILFCLKYRLTPVRIAEVIRSSGILRFFKVNIFIVLRTLCIIFVTTWFTRVGAEQGTMMLAVNTLLLQLFMLFSYFMDGFAYAGEALAGKFMGMGDRASLKACVIALMKWGLSISLLFTLIYFLGGTRFLGVLSGDPSVAEASKEFMPWALAVPFVGFATFVWDGVYIGMTKTRQMFVSMLLAAIVFLAVYIALFPSMGNHALWLAFILYLAIRGLILTIISRGLYTRSGAEPS